MQSESNKTTKSAAYIRDELIGEMAHILYEIAPPDAQRIIARKMDELRFAVQREMRDEERLDAMEAETRYGQS